MSTMKAGSRKAVMIGGFLAAAGLVGYFASQYPPSPEETAGTIVPAKRFVAPGAGGANTIAPVGDAAVSTGTTDGGASGVNGVNGVNAVAGQNGVNGVAAQNGINGVAGQNGVNGVAAQNGIN